MNVCLLGDAKTGKTASCNTLPGRSVLLNFDPGGHASLRRPYKLNPIGTGATLDSDLQTHDFVVFDYTSAQSAVSTDVTRKGRSAAQRNAFTTCVTDMNAALTCARCDNLILDGLTGFSDVVMGYVMAVNNRAKAVFEDWGQAIEKINEVVSVCAATSPHFILMCHTQVERDELTGRIKETPLVYGKQLPNRLLALFDNVFQTGVSGGVYFWYTHPQPLLATIGSRTYDNLPERMVPSFTDLFGGTPRDAMPKGGTQPQR